MAHFETVYLGDLRTKSVHLKSGDQVVTDAPIDNQGKGEAFSPTDLMSTSLATCMLTIMGIAAQSHKIKLEGTRAEISKIMAQEPRRVSEIIIDFYFPKDITYTEKERKILEKAAVNCPVAKSLNAALIQNVRFHFE